MISDILQYYNILMKSPIKSTHNSTNKNITRPKNAFQNYKMVTIHLIDAVYQGFVNSSYQRDGFGLLQTQNYQLYMGFFRYNKMHGLGLIIYPNGSIVYGNFDQGKLSGIALIDNVRGMQIGIFEHQGIIGIGFEYTHQTLTWRMNRYHKYVPIDILNQEKMENHDAVPEIFKFESQIIKHFWRYKSKKLFITENGQAQNPFYSLTKDINSVYVHEISPNLQFYGAIIQSKYEGIGLLLDKETRNVLETGVYSNGLLHGFAMKKDQRTNYQSKGLYVKGKKQGLFMQNRFDKIKFFQFYREQQYKEEKRQQNEKTFKKYQRLYNFRCKDFASIRHGMQLQNLMSMFETPDYKVWKFQIQNDKKQKEKSASKLMSQKIRTPPHRNTHSIINTHSYEKSSLFLIQQKISLFKSKKNQSYSLNNKHEKTIDLKIIETTEPKQAKDDAKFDNYVQEEIAIQQNPFQFLPILSYKRKIIFRKD